MDASSLLKFQGQMSGMLSGPFGLPPNFPAFNCGNLANRNHLKDNSGPYNMLPSFPHMGSLYPPVPAPLPSPVHPPPPISASTPLRHRAGGGGVPFSSPGLPPPLPMGHISNPSSYPQGGMGTLQPPLFYDQFVPHSTVSSMPIVPHALLPGGRPPHLPPTTGMLLPPNFSFPGLPPPTPRHSGGAFSHLSSPGQQLPPLGATAAAVAMFDAMRALGPQVFSRQLLDIVLYGAFTSGSGIPHALSGLRMNLSEPSASLEGKSKVHSIGKLHSSQPSSHNMDLPKGLLLRQSVVGGVAHLSIFNGTALITKGTVFGPYRGKVINTSEMKTNDENSFMWEIFESAKLSHFIDGRGSSGNWMAQVNPARHQSEQNLDAEQINGEIFYRASQDIPAGQELLVWYGPSYNDYYGIPMGLHRSANTRSSSITSGVGPEGVTSVEPSPTSFAQQESENSDGFSCDRCGKMFAYKYYRDKHLKYTRCVDQGNRKFPCTLCTRSFEKRDRLRIHVLHVHERHRPHKCTVCAKTFSQSSSLNKHLRVHSGERPYKCCYCSKAFTASSILRTHIRQHSGEKPFKCKFCMKSFASHAAHDSHVRRTHPKDKVQDLALNWPVNQNKPLHRISEHSVFEMLSEPHK